MADIEQLREQLNDYLTVGRTFTMESETEARGGQTKIGVVYPPFGSDQEPPVHSLETMGAFTVECDEPARLGGAGTAPQPLQYFLAGTAF